MTDSNANRTTRQIEDHASIKALAELLRNVAERPNEYLKDNILRAALKSQGALAAFARPDLQIRQMSLNHQKLVATDALGAYSLLDVLRKGCAEALTLSAGREIRGNRKSKAGLTSKVSQLESDRALLLQDLFILQRAYDLRCIQARSYAQSADKATQIRCSKEQKELDASFSLRRKPITSGKVVDIKRGEKT